MGSYYSVAGCSITLVWLFCAGVFAFTGCMVCTFMFFGPILPKAVFDMAYFVVKICGSTNRGCGCFLFQKVQIIYSNIYYVAIYLYPCKIKKCSPEAQVRRYHMRF